MYRRELSTFLTVAREGSFQKASRDLFLTPASVMNQINTLETEVGVPLFVRTTHGVTLTEAGRSLCADAKAIIRLSQEAVDRARQAASKSRQTIRVGTSILRPCRTLVDLWSRLDDGTLPVTIQIVPFEDDPASLEAMVNSLGREIDCFVAPCGSLTWQERCSILLLDPIPCCIAVPRNHPLSRRASLTWEDLEGETLLLLKRGQSPVVNYSVLKRRASAAIQRPTDVFPFNLTYTMLWSPTHVTWRQ